MKALIFDTETSGLVFSRLLPLDKQPEVIEFYGVLVDLKTDQEIKTFGTLIKPNKPISDEIIKITGITNEMLSSQLSFENFAGKIKEFIETVPCVIAHNATFDQEIMDIAFSRIEQTITWPKIICTVEQTIHLTGRRLSLTNLHTFLFGSDFKEAHRAENDVEALRRCCVKLYEQGDLM